MTDYKVEYDIEKRLYQDLLTDYTLLCAERDRLLHDYHELIMAVAAKYPGETRHQTALRYIRRAEESCNISEQAALTPAGGGKDHDS